MNPWPARWPTGLRSTVYRYPLDAAADFKAGAFVVLDAQSELTECGADPASILGISCDPSADVVEAGYCNVYVADDNLILAMEGTSDPTAANVGNDFGIVKTDGVWYVDITDTTNTRVMVVDIDTVRNLFFCKVLVANRQLG